MGIYGYLKSVEPQEVKVGEEITATVSVFNNVGAGYVTVDIKDAQTGEIIHSLDTYTQLGETTTTVSFKINEPGKYCLIAVPRGGSPYPGKSFWVEEIYVNGKRVWLNGKQTRTAWMELINPETEETEKNSVTVKFRLIPIYSQTEPVNLYVEGCSQAGTVQGTFSEGTHTISQEVWFCAGKQSSDLLQYYDTVAGYTKAWSPENGPGSPNPYPIEIEYTFTEAGNYILNINGIIAVFWTYIDVYLNGVHIGSHTHESGDASTANAHFNVLNVQPGDKLLIRVTSYEGAACGFESATLTKENEITFTIGVNIYCSYGNYNIPINCRGYCDNWFGGARWEDEKITEGEAIEVPCITITVVGEPEIVCTDVKASKTNPLPGETITITATIENKGTAEGTEYFDLFVNDTPQNLQKSVTLAPGESTTLTWNITFPDPGTYSVCVDKAIQTYL